MNFIKQHLPDFNQFQRDSLATDQIDEDDPYSLIVPLLGIAGEAGTLLAEYKKYIRDGNSYLGFRDQVSEELGDLLWYVSNIASKFDLALDDIAKQNLKKTRERWLPQELAGRSDGVKLASLDAEFPPEERIPESFDIEFRSSRPGELDKPNGDGVEVLFDGEQVGDRLVDQAHRPDGYRFHDIFHLAYAAHLGWSPVTRKLLNRRRRTTSDSPGYITEDQARARIIEEAISQVIFTYAQSHNFLEGVKRVDFVLLQLVKSLAANYEVRSRTLASWERAILSGYDVWRKLRRSSSATVRVNLAERSLSMISCHGSLEVSK